MAEIELPEGATLAAGKPREELGQLEGRAYKPVAPVAPTPPPTATSSNGSSAPPTGAPVALVARHERAGVVRAEVALD